MKINELKKDWEKLTNEYVKNFCEKHEISFEEEYMWVADVVGGIVNVGDYFIDFSIIKYDIDNNISEEKFDKWYWKSLEVYQITEENYLSYEAFCKGAPDKWTTEYLEKIKVLKQNVENAKQILEKEILDMKKEQDD